MVDVSAGFSEADWDPVRARVCPDVVLPNLAGVRSIESRLVSSNGLIMESIPEVVKLGEGFAAKLELLVVFAEEIFVAGLGELLKEASGSNVNWDGDVEVGAKEKESTGGVETGYERVGLVGAYPPDSSKLFRKLKQFKEKRSDNINYWNK